MNKTSIEWTDFSANPIKYRDANGRVVWACVHASPGCQHCYAETLAHRYGKGGPFNVPTTAAVTPFLDELELRRMLTYKPAAGKRCFVGDMTDVFGPWVPDELLNKLFSQVFEQRRDITWQLLTKRADRMRAYLAWRWADRLVPKHIWLGVSCEDQQRADERIPLLLQTPAVVRFVSAEPLLDSLNLSRVWMPDGDDLGSTLFSHGDGSGIDWVIVGGESGPGARPCNVELVRSLIAQCRAAGVPCFVKQLGSDNVSALGFGPLDGVRHRKGGDMSEWPQDVRVREFPA